MKRYSQLTASQKANFRSFCVAQRFALYGMSGFYDACGWYPMAVDGIAVNMNLFPFQFDRPYGLGDITGKNGSIIKVN
jgi:hypothetical protein